MQTIKTGVVVVLLIAVCYGAFVALNAPETDIPDELKQWANSAEAEGFMDIEMPSADSSFSFDLSTAESISPDDVSFGTPPPASNDLPTFPALTTATTVGIPAADTSKTQSQASLPAFPDMPANSNSANASSTTNAASLDGPAIPFDATDLPLPEKTLGEYVSTRSSVTSAPPAELADWSNSLDVPLLLDEGSRDVPQENASNQTPLPTVPFEIAREQALAKANSGALREALEMLTPFYGSPELVSSQQADLVDILDALSREAIYSNRHLLQAAHVVAANDTLESVATAQQISPELLASINGLGNAKALIAGTKLKVIQGPFNAKISLVRGELTLFLGNLYAGRFPISIGKDDKPTEGVFPVVDRRRDRSYYGPGVLIQAGEPDNPYGKHWLSLGNNLSIHGSPEMARSDLKQAGCISLSPLDAADVYNILTKQSQVEIRL